VARRVPLATRANETAAAANMRALAPKTDARPNNATTEAASTGPAISLTCWVPMTRPFPAPSSVLSFRTAGTVEKEAG
jgi:hypothetical protein